MNNSQHKLAIAVTGASGSVYAKVLLDKITLLKEQFTEVSLVFSDNAKTVWQFELGKTWRTSNRNHILSS